MLGQGFSEGFSIHHVTASTPIIVIGPFPRLFSPEWLSLSCSGPANDLDIMAFAWAGNRAATAANMLTGENLFPGADTTASGVPGIRVGLAIASRTNIVHPLHAPPFPEKRYLLIAIEDGITATGDSFYHGRVSGHIMQAA